MNETCAGRWMERGSERGDDAREATPRRSRGSLGALALGLAALVSTTGLACGGEVVEGAPGEGTEAEGAADEESAAGSVASAQARACERVSVRFTREELGCEGRGGIYPAGFVDDYKIEGRVRCAYEALERAANEVARKRRVGERVGDDELEQKRAFDLLGRISSHTYDNRNYFTLGACTANALVAHPTESRIVVQTGTVRY